MSKRKRGGADKPADPTKSAAEAPGESTKSLKATPDAVTSGAAKAGSRKAGSGLRPPTEAARAASGSARNEARAATPTEPPAPQGKPIKIANLRVPPLPQLDTGSVTLRSRADETRASAGNGASAEPRAAKSAKSSPPPTSASTRASTRPPPVSARAPEGALRPRASEPPKPESVPEAKLAEPELAQVEPPASSAPVVPPPAPAVRPDAPEARVSAAVGDDALGDDAVESPRAAAAAAEVRPDDAPFDSAASILRSSADEPRPAPASAQPVVPNLHLVDSRMPVNGAIFDGAGDEDIWTEGIENTASAASALPAEKAANEQDDARSHAPAARLARGSTGDRAREAAAFGSSQSLLSTDYYFRQYGAHGLRSMAAEVDDFGFDPHVDAKVRPLLETLCKRYFRVELEGAEQVPEHGRALLVANRSGALPWDGLVLRTALRTARPGLSPLRWLAEDSVIHYPFMGVFMNRLGAVRACPENAERLLTQDRLVAVFPEGAQGSRKLFRDRYRLQRFGRGGYVKLALKLGVPILPTAIIGAEETNPVLGRSRLLGRFVGSDSVPITPTFPWLGLAGLLPAPVRWRIVVGAPIDLSAYGPDSAEDALVVHRLNEQIRSSLQTLVDRGKQQRGSALFG